MTAWLESAVGVVVYRLRLPAEPDDAAGAAVDLVSPSLWDVMGVPLHAPFADWFANIHPEDRERVEAASDAAATAGGRFETTMRMWHPGAQEWRHLRAVSHPVTDADGTRCFNGLIIDVTREAEALEREAALRGQLEAAERLEAIGHLAGGIAHDFNNLLMVIGSNAQLVADNVESGDVGEFVTAIERQVEMGAELTQQLLGYARQGTYQPVTTELIEIVTTRAQTLGRTRPDVRIDLQLPAAAWVHADPSQLDRVCMNIMMNALEAMPDGGTLVIGLRTQSGHHELSFVDDGIGIEPGTQAQVFEPFFSTKTSLAHRPGTGLGLAATCGIVESLGGRITVESEPGHGTRMTVSLAALPDLPAPGPTPDAGPEPAQPTKAFQVLVIDDQEPVRTALTALVRSLGHTCVDASSGEAALAALGSKHDTEVVIMDMVMPGLAGLDLLAELRTRAPHVSVMCATGRADDTLVQDALDRGAVGLLKKPFGRAELHEAFDNIQRQRHRGGAEDGPMGSEAP